MYRDSSGREPASAARAAGLWLVRYGIGIAMVLAGVVLAVSSSQFGVDGFAMAVGGGLAVLLINMLFRLGASGDLEREREEAARRYFDEHGEWPEDEQRSRGRTWTLAPGVVTPEQEGAEQEAAEQRRQIIVEQEAAERRRPTAARRRSTPSPR